MLSAHGTGRCKTAEGISTLQMAQDKGHVATPVLLQVPARVHSGTRVVLHGLVQAAELNGRAGKVRSWVSGRYDVEIVGASRASSVGAASASVKGTGARVAEKLHFVWVKGGSLWQQPAVQGCSSEAPTVTAVMPVVGTVLGLHESSGASSAIYSVITGGAPAGSEEM